MTFSWLSVEARTGRIIAELPLLDAPKVKQSIARYETTSATLPINLEDAPPDWLRATKRGAAHLVLLTDNPNDPAHGIPLIGYKISRRRRNESDTITLDMVTAEAYFDQRFVGDEAFAAVGQNTIISTLVTNYATDTGPKHGIPIRTQMVTAGAGIVRDRNYFDYNDKTLYSALVDLAGVIGGPEWYVGWEWQYNPDRLTPVLCVGDRIGTAATMAPNAVFDMPGCVSSFDLLEDYGVNRGGNDVMATSSGQGDTRPQSPHQVAPTDDMPTFEVRFTPSTSIVDVNTLTSHAQAKLALTKAGSTALSLTAAVEAAPVLGVDWFLGDDLGYAIGGLDQSGRDTVPAFPGGISGIARNSGWELTLDDTPFVTPILISPTGAFDG